MYVRLPWGSREGESVVVSASCLCVCVRWMGGEGGQVRVCARRRADNSLKDEGEVVASGGLLQEGDGVPGVAEDRGERVGQPLEL